MKFNFRRQDGLATILELLGLGFVRAFTSDLIPSNGVVRKVTDIAFGAAATAAVLSYTVPKVTDFVKVTREKKDSDGNGSGSDISGEAVSDDYQEVTDEQSDPEPVSTGKKLVNIVSGALSDTIKKVLEDQHFQCIKIVNSDPNKEMLFAVLSPEDADKIKSEYDCDVYIVKEPAAEAEKETDDIEEGDLNE